MANRSLNDERFSVEFYFSAPLDVCKRVFLYPSHLYHLNASAFVATLRSFQILPRKLVQWGDSGGYHHLSKQLIQFEPGPQLAALHDVWKMRCIYW